MKNKKRILIYLIIAIGFVLILTNSCQKDEALSKKDPVINWTNPEDISFGTLLSEIQLNATADVPGTFVYIPPIGTKLNEGTNQDLKVVFTPTDSNTYNAASKTVKINVTAPITVTDIDGNLYNTVVIGTQVWMKENLKVTHYRNGDSIPNVTSDSEWKNLTTGAYCNYLNSVNIANTYGRLYNWYAVNDSRNIAPTGWHIPSESEWMHLINYLGGYKVAGNKLKEAGSTHWHCNTNNAEATNESGFTALPGGFRIPTETCEYLGFYGSFFGISDNKGWSVQICCGDFFIDMNLSGNTFGQSVRCIKD
jgi:uncharacterized protein (TIGR02145 family)